MSTEATVAVRSRTGALARPAAALGLAGASGVLLALSAPPIGFGWLAWIALVPAVLVSLGHGATRVGRAAVPLAYGVYLELLIVPALPFGIAEDQWGDPVVPVMVGDSPVLAAALVGIPLFVGLLYAIRFPFLVRSVRHNALLGIAVPAVVWTAVDVLRVKLDPSGLWGPVFLTQHDLPTARLAAVGGPWLLTFAIVGTAYAVAYGLLGRRGLVPAIAVVVLVAVPATTAAGDRTVRVAVVQPGYDTAEFERPVLHYLRRRTRNLPLASRDLIRDLAPLTREAARRGARLVVWPEAVLWVDPRENVLVRGELRRLARATGTSIVAPYFLRGPDHGAAVVVLPNGRLTRPQPKQRPMWFLGERGGNRVEPRPVSTPVGRVGTLLGVDNQDAAVARALADAGADLLVSSTHDWKQLAPQQRAYAQIHAVAVGRPLLRADWRDGSAIVGRDGDLIADAGEATRRTVLVADVEPSAGRTLYVRVGDMFAWLAVAGAALVAAAAVGIRWRATAG